MATETNHIWFASSPSVIRLLVTANNPARAGLLGMVHARCAARHNYLVHYAGVAERRIPTRLHNTIFSAHGAAPEALYPRLDLSLAAFLNVAMLLPVDTPEPPPFSLSRGSLTPDGVFDNQTVDMYDEPEKSLGGESGGGSFYYRGHHPAFFMHMDNHGFGLPFSAQTELWHLFETIFSSWIDLVHIVHIGTIKASPRASPAHSALKRSGRRSGAPAAKPKSPPASPRGIGYAALSCRLVGGGV
ncbi:hypothetical protein P885DRAFT_56583 [Corynascus similis CBS 632.67]